MIRTIVVLALAWGLSANAFADDKSGAKRAETDRLNADFLSERLERLGVSSLDTSANPVDTSDTQADTTVAAGNTPAPRRGRVGDTSIVSGVGYINHLAIGFAIGLRENRIGSDFVFPNGKPGGSIQKPFTPVPGGDDGVIDDGGLNPGGGSLNPGEGPCFNCTVNPSPDD